MHNNITIIIDLAKPSSRAPGPDFQRPIKLTQDKQEI